MRTFAQKQKPMQTGKSESSARPYRAFSERSRKVSSIFQLQPAIGNQALQRSLQSNADELEACSAITASTRFAYNFSRIPVLSPSPTQVHPKLIINTPGDTYEQEADRVAEHVIRMPEPELRRDQTCPCGGGCPKCRAEQLSHQPQVLQKMRVQENDTGETTAPAMAYDVLRSSGQPLHQATRAFFESRFGHDFSRVRVHADSKAAQSARAINAAAYTAGHHIVFGAGKLPGQNALTAHELTHVLQQTTHSNQLPNNVQRQIPTETFGEVWGETVYEISEQSSCLWGLTDEMEGQTWWYLRTACGDGNYLTSLAGVTYIPEDRADAFGHCWIGCQGAKTCGQETTRTYGTAYEDFREAMSYLSPAAEAIRYLTTIDIRLDHNSYEEDIWNQKRGRELARSNPDGDCSNLCYQAVVGGALRFHGHNTAEHPIHRIYNCSDITINGREYLQGWRFIPGEHVERF